MPAAVKRGRKAQNAASLAAKKAPASASITSFARVSKTVTAADIKKEPSAVFTPSTKANVQPDTASPASRKRKARTAAPDEDIESSADEKPAIRSKPAAAAASKAPASSPAAAAAAPPKRGRGRPPKKSRPEPAPRKRGRSPSPCESEKSALDAGTLFKRLRIESSPSRQSSPLTADTSLAGSDADDELQSPGQLPTDAQCLVPLHAALLKSLTLHYAHNGTHAPADFRVLCPNVARAWGKRSVSPVDIRTCLGVLDSAAAAGPSNNGPLFSLVDYGRQKVCVELTSNCVSGLLNEKKLNDMFARNLDALWEKHVQGGGNASDAAAFVKSLPKASVTVCDSVAKAAPVLAKGQRRLEDLKHGIALKKQEKENKALQKFPAAATPPQQNDTPMTNAATPSASAKLSLLERLRLKSQQQQTAAEGSLSPEQLARRAALQRVPEVASLVSMLSRSSGDGGRVSFPMPMFLDRLKDSLRMGISREEGAACARLLASEVAPAWVRVLSLAGRGENVVVDADRTPSKAEIERVVNDLLARGA